LVKLPVTFLWLQWALKDWRVVKTVAESSTEEVCVGCSGLRAMNEWEINALINLTA